MAPLASSDTPPSGGSSTDSLEVADRSGRVRVDEPTDLVAEQARANAEKARAIIDLYDRLKDRVRSRIRSQYAIPLLDQMFQRPLFQSGHLQFGDVHPPSRQSVFRLLRMMQEDGILKVVREGRGRRAQVLVFAELVNLCEGHEVF